jgi:hypothetical protein
MEILSSRTDNFIFASDSISCRKAHRRKATTWVAFRWFPVCLALLFSIASIVLMMNLRPFTISDTSAHFTIGPQSFHTYPSCKTYPDSVTETHSPLSPIFTEEVFFWEAEILRWSEVYGLDPNIIAVVMQIESCGHPTVQSRSGAIGLFQVMPFHFRSGENPFDPDINAERGLSYLARALALASDDPVLAFAGYNGGHGVIALDPALWPEETKRYVYWGAGILADISNGYVHSPRLGEWIEAGGSSLCERSASALGLGS